MALPADGLDASMGMHTDRRHSFPDGDGRNRGGAGAGAGRLGFTHSALKETSSYIAFVFNGYQLNIHSLLEVVMVSNFGRLRLPSRSKLRDKNYIVRVAHGDGNAPNFPRSEPERKFSSDLRFAHSDFEFELSFVARNQRTSLQTSAGANYDLFFGAFRTKISGDTTRAVAGDFRLGAIGVEQSRVDIGVR